MCLVCLGCPPLVNPQRMRRRVTVVGSVCVSVKSPLTSGVSVHPENTVTYSASSKGQKICGFFSETVPFQRSSTPSIERPNVQSAISLRKVCMRI